MNSVYTMKNIKTIKYNRKHGGINKTKKCMDKLYAPKLLKYKKEMKTRVSKIQKEIKSIEQKIQKTTNEKQKKVFLEKKTELENEISQQKMIVSVHNITEKLAKKQYCNTGCVATMFEKGTTLSKDFMKNFEENMDKIFRYPDLSPTKEKEKIQTEKQKLVKMMIDERKKLFGNKTNVLVDDFYEGLKPNQIKKMKDAGAISGCTKTFYPAEFEK